MKEYIICAIILIFVACEKEQRYDDIVLMHNFTIPENLPFQLESQSLLKDSIFNVNIPDSSRMQRLDPETTIQILQLCYKLFEYDMYDTVPPEYLEKTSCYIYGKLDLQASVKSIVVWGFGKYTLVTNRHLWLLNMKNNKLCSVMLLDSKPETWIDDPSLYSKTYLKNKLFNFREERVDNVSFGIKLEWWLHGTKDNMINYFSYCKVNENGFIEFVDI